MLPFILPICYTVSDGIAFPLRDPSTIMTLSSMALDATMVPPTVCSGSLPFSFFPFMVYQSLTGRSYPAAAKSLQSCPTLCYPIDRLHCPWDSPGKNTGAGCHFLLQCMKVKSEREVAQWCPTLSDPMDCSPPGSSVHGIFQARVLEWGAIALFPPKTTTLKLLLPHHQRPQNCQIQ